MDTRNAPTPSNEEAKLPLTAGLARFAAQTPPVPRAALDAARAGITDAAGLMIAARHEPVVQHARAHALAGSPSGRSSVLFTGQLARARDAAFVNAVAAHAYAMDDVAWGCHPSAVLLPTLLAVGEASACNGLEALTAWVVGFEVIAELASREHGSWHTTGWHPTGVVAPVAAAAAAAHLMKLTPERTRHALGIAASFGGGLSVNFGTPTKALHAGRAASAGVEAAELAALGVTASAQALEHANGLLHTLSPRQELDLATPFDAASPPWRAAQAGSSIKKYPLCYSLHRIADAAIDLGLATDFDTRRIASIDVWIGSRQAAMAHHVTPSTDLEARYSAHFAVACGLLAHAAGFAQLVPDFYRSAAVGELIARTQLHPIDETSADDPVFAPADRVVVRMQGGKVFDSGEVRFARGHHSIPLSTGQLEQKFMDCTAALEGGVAGQLFGRLQQLDRLDDLRDLSMLARDRDTK